MSSARGAAEEILQHVTDTRPYLGFFDFYGVGERDSLEIEVPDFAGTPDYADVAFWNIEHFNDSVSQERIQDAGEVISRLSMDVIGPAKVQQGALTRLITALAHHYLHFAFPAEPMIWSFSY